MKTMRTVLGIDLGTQSLKTVFYDYESRRIAASASSPLELDRGPGGKAEQEAGWWLAALEDCLGRIDQSVRESVRAIAVSGQQHGFVPLDAEGEVLAPVKLWCDTAAEAQAAEITRRLGGRERAIEAAGNPVLAGYTAPKVLWLKQQRPEDYRRLAHILLPHDYLNHALTGEIAMEYGDASGTGLMDVRRRRWSRQMLEALDPERDLAPCLPLLSPEDRFIGTVTPAAARRFGLPAGVPVAPGGGDNMMGAIGTGNVRPGNLTISLGSSGTLYACASQPVIDPEGHIAAFCSSTGQWLPLLCTMNCTLATELIRDLLEIGIEDFDALAGSAPPGADGLTVLPFFNGERTPDLPYARGCVLGLTAGNCAKGHLLRATIEATAYSLRFGLEQMQRLGLRAERIALTGGGARSALWRRVIADCFQLPVTVFKGDEGASFGAALQALWLLRRREEPGLDITVVCGDHLAPDAEKSVLPDPGRGEVYGAGYHEYRRLLDRLTPFFTTPEKAER